MRRGTTTTVREDAALLGFDVDSDRPFLAVKDASRVYGLHGRRRRDHDTLHPLLAAGRRPPLPHSRSHYSLPDTHTPAPPHSANTQSSLIAPSRTPCIQHQIQRLAHKMDEPLRRPGVRVPVRRRTELSTIGTMPRRRASSDLTATAPKRKCVAEEQREGVGHRVVGTNWAWVTGLDGEMKVKVKDGVT
ncbi:hypothetical protein K438DRAFT_1793651 [Mycena galopus ATCC 62051]|nr:hypothetical protein K438DRAFT_1793651 [Mycena galopus ATCC 62051]